MTEHWTFTHFDVLGSENGLTNVVSVIHWRLTLTDGLRTAEVYGSTDLGDADPQSFTPFGEITKAWSIEAVRESIGIEEIVASLSSNNDAQKKTTPPPFTDNSLSTWR